MRTLTIKNIPDDVYERLKQQAELNRRSLNSEVIVLIERSVGSAKYPPEVTLERARRLREKTQGYSISDEELEAAIEDGRQVLTIAVDPEVYEGLLAATGGQEVGILVEELVRSHVLFPDLEDAYRQMAEDEERELEALEWAEAVLGDVSDEAR